MVRSILAALISLIFTVISSGRSVKRPKAARIGPKGSLGACAQLAFRGGHHCSCTTKHGGSDAIAEGAARNNNEMQADMCQDSRRQENPLLFPPISGQVTSLPKDVAMKLSGKTVTGIGDSLGLQAYMAMRCFVEESGYNITFGEFVSLHVIPLEGWSLGEYLRRKLVGVDVAFVDFGHWYSWDWGQSDRFTTVRDANSSTTAMLTNACRNPVALRRSLTDAMAAWKNSGYNDDIINPIYDQARIRRNKCFDVMLGRAAFASDLMRLNEVIAADAQLPGMVWKELSPQHFSFDSSGKWVKNSTARESATLGDTVRHCAEITDHREAYQLNEIANRVVGGKTSVFLAVARTWKADLRSWNLHAQGECTHYCNPSIVTWNWAGKLFGALASAASRVGVERVSVKRAALVSVESARATLIYERAPHRLPVTTIKSPMEAEDLGVDGLIGSSSSSSSPKARPPAGRWA